MSSLEQHTDYDGPQLDEALFGADPLLRFSEWLADAEQAELADPNAMVLSTVDADGSPSSRTVLLKALESGRFEFVTNAGSRKGRALAHEARVTLLFPWYPLHRQVIVSGRATPASAEISDAYWSTRPRSSNLAAWASDQSQPVGGRVELESRMRDAERRFEGVTDIPRPEHWGAWLVEPATIEFWQGRPSRLHDRLLFRAGADGWSVSRLQP